MLLHIFKIIFTLALILSGLLSYSQGVVTGEPSPILNNTYTYSFSYVSPLTGAVWTCTNGTVISQSTSTDKLTANASIKWTTSGQGTITLKLNAVTIATKLVSISGGTTTSVPEPTLTPYIVTGGTATPGNSICGTTSFRIDAIPGRPGTTSRWYSTATGGTYFYEGTSYTTPVLTSSVTYYVTSYYDDGSTMVAPPIAENSVSTMKAALETSASSTATAPVSGQSTRKAITLTVNPAVSVPTNLTGGGNFCGLPQLILNASPGSGGTQIQWFTSLTGTTPVYTGTPYKPNPVTATIYAATYNPSTLCTSSRVNTTVTVNPAPTAPIGVFDDVIVGAGQADITVQPGVVADKVRWYKSSDGIETPVEGTHFVSPRLTASTLYYITSYNSTTNCESTPRRALSVTVIPYITPATMMQDNIRTPGIKTNVQINGLKADKKTSVVSYFDGLTRTTQQIIVRGSPKGYDVVRPMEYDAYGRVAKSYLPYVGSTRDGSIHAIYKTELVKFYTAINDKVANDSVPYTSARYEASPLGRTLEQGNVGKEWQTGTGHTQQMKYSYNSGIADDETESVRFFKGDGTSIWYGANLLTRTEVRDENGNRQIVFTDKAGRVVVKKQQLEESINSVIIHFLQTYYLYDDFGRLKYIVSPKGTAALIANGWAFNQTILDNYCYQFVYDSRGRTVEKKVPGQAWIYYAYDKFNRLVLVQDGLLRAVNKWSFVKYDIKNRPVVQGVYLNTSQVTRSSIQTKVNDFYSGSVWYESRTATGYTNVSFPVANADAGNTPLELQGFNFYDSYDFDDADAVPDFNYVNQNMPGENLQAQGQSYGLPTGSKRVVLNSSPAVWLYTYVFYDKQGRAIQIRSNNHLSATVDNLTTSVYDFEGKVMVSKNYHNAGTGKNTTVINTYSYDSLGRLLRVYQNNNTASADQLVAQYEYNELGQMVDKKLHNTTGTNFIQSVDYRYTIQGRLSSINNAQLATDALNDDTNDFFGMELLYNTTESGLTTASDIYYNGNISAVKWKSIGADAGTADQQSFKYVYDKSDKLKAATSQVSGGGTWTKEAAAHNETISYDHNGNIQSLKRNQRKYQLTGTVVSYGNESIDNLSYNYDAAIGDRLLKVTDAVTAVTATAGFNNGTSGVADDYAYDVNGNVLSDKNKGISNITYNLIGKAALVTFDDGRKLEYVYDASGSKLTMKTYATGGTLQTTTDYVDGFVYENNVLSFFGSPEGRVVNNGGNLEYQYAIADNQGNTRVVFGSIAPATVSLTASFEGDSSDKSNQFVNAGSNVVPFAAANHTAAGSYVVKMNQTNKLGPSKTLSVFPGDKVDMQVWQYYEASSGFGTTSTSLASAITTVAGLLGGVSGGAAESGLKYTGVSSGLTSFGIGGNLGDGQPSAYLNYILFDKNYNVLDAGYKSATNAAAYTQQLIKFNTVNITEPGYIYVYLSYEDDSNNWVYFDDFNVTTTPTNVVQYDEYYPFGLQTSRSWTRDNTKNDFKYNAGSELNNTNGLYEMFYRGYDAAIGRMMQIDPYAASFSSETPYNYAGCNPVSNNDPSGGKKLETLHGLEIFNSFSSSSHIGPGSGNHWSDDLGFSASASGMSVGDFLGNALGNSSNSGGTWTGGEAHFFATDKEGADWALEHLDEFGGHQKSAYATLMSISTGIDPIHFVNPAKFKVVNGNNVAIKSWWKQKTQEGVNITVTDHVTGTALVRGYPDNATDANGNIVYSVPLYELIVSWNNGGKTQSESFNVIRFGVKNIKSTGRGPSMTGVNSGTYSLTPGNYMGGWHIDGASVNNKVWLHAGPIDVTRLPAPGAINCVEICGGQWGDFKNLINGLGGASTITFTPTITPPLTDSGRRFIYKTNP